MGSISCITILFLGICTLIDLWKKRVWWPLAGGYMFFILALHFFQKDITVGGILTGILPGLGLLFLSWVTKEAVGYGDGMVVTACGTALGLPAVFQMLFLAFGLAAVWSGILLAVKRVGRKERFPFVPFLLLAQICLWSWK